MRHLRQPMLRASVEVLIGARENSHKPGLRDGLAKEQPRLERKGLMSSKASRWLEAKCPADILNMDMWGGECLFQITLNLKFCAWLFITKNPCDARSTNSRQFIKIVISYSPTNQNKSTVAFGVNASSLSSTIYMCFLVKIELRFCSSYWLHTDLQSDIS